MEELIEWERGKLKCQRAYKRGNMERVEMNLELNIQWWTHCFISDSVKFRENLFVLICNYKQNAISNQSCIVLTVKSWVSVCVFIEWEGILVNTIQGMIASEKVIKR